MARTLREGEVTFLPHRDVFETLDLLGERVSNRTR